MFYRGQYSDEISKRTKKTQHLRITFLSNSPATVGQSNGDGAEKQAAFGLTDDSLTIGSRGNDHKLSQTIPKTIAVTEEHHQHIFIQVALSLPNLAISLHYNNNTT